MKSENQVATNTRQLLAIQIALGLIVAAGFKLALQEWQSVSAIFGMLTSVALTILLSHGVKRAEREALQDPNKSMGILYLGAVQRFVLVLAFFIIGLGIFKLEPLAMALGFGLTQFAYIFNMRNLRKKF